MNKTTSIFIKVLSALVFACAMAAISAPPAAAQTARNLKCKGCVNSKDIKNKSIRTNDIRNNAVNGAKVKNGSLTSVDISNVAGADFAGGDQLINLPNSARSVREVNISAPSGGQVIVIASGVFDFVGTGLDSVGCSITAGAIALDSNHSIAADDTGINTSRAIVPFAGTRGFTVGAGTTTFRLVCAELTGGVAVRDSQLTAMFFATRY